MCCRRGLELCLPDLRALGVCLVSHVLSTCRKYILAKRLFRLMGARGATGRTVTRESIEAVSGAFGIAEHQHVPAYPCCIPGVI